MLFASVSHPLSSLPPFADGVEWRLDLFAKKEPLSLPPFPVMLTMRKASHEQIERLLELEPPFFDLEYDREEKFLERVLRSYPKTKFVLSYHNFQETPLDLEGLYQTMRRYPAYTYKIAVLSNSTNDALRTLLFAGKHPDVSAICMGEKGSFARVLGFNNRINYASLAEKTAPGQLSLDELVQVYRYPKLNAQTELYGLIGDPIEASQGHIYHNNVFEHKNAVYVKMCVRPDELSDFFPLAKEIGFRGLSVTMPLKEKVLPFLDRIDTCVGAVNTIAFRNNQLLGTNTDGAGALDAIEKRGLVQGKRVVILGAGGAARAVAFEAKRRGAEVWIVNRTLQKAQALAEAVGGFIGAPSGYDVLINCSPDPLPIEPSFGTLVMDSVYVPKETLFIQKFKGCPIVYGDEMFYNQAAAQTRFWGH